MGHGLFVLQNPTHEGDKMSTQPTILFYNHKAAKRSDPERFCGVEIDVFKKCLPAHHTLYHNEVSLEDIYNKIDLAFLHVPSDSIDQFLKYGEVVRDQIMIFITEAGTLRKRAHKIIYDSTTKCSRALLFVKNFSALNSTEVLRAFLSLTLKDAKKVVQRIEVNPFVAHSDPFEPGFNSILLPSISILCQGYLIALAMSSPDIQNTVLFKKAVTKMGYSLIKDKQVLIARQKTNQALNEIGTKRYWSPLGTEDIDDSIRYEWGKRTYKDDFESLGELLNLIRVKSKSTKITGLHPELVSRVYLAIKKKSAYS